MAKYVALMKPKINTGAKRIIYIYTSSCSTIDIFPDFLYCWGSPLLHRRNVNWTAKVLAHAIRYQVLIISNTASPHPVSTFSAVWWCRRTIQLNVVMRTKWQSFMMKSKIPSWMCWWKACIGLPVRLTWPHWPIPAGCIGLMWPCSHTTEGPRLSYLSKYLPEPIPSQLSQSSQSF